MMNHWLVIALAAYLIGAAIEGVNTVSQLSHSLPELVKSIQAQPQSLPPQIVRVGELWRSRLAS